MSKLILCLLLCPAIAAAELGVCFDDSPAGGRTPGNQFYWMVHPPGQIKKDPNCTVITKQSGQTQAQTDLIQSTVQRPQLPNPTQPATKYLHVLPVPPDPTGLAVLFDETKMQEIDDYITAQQSKQLSWYEKTQTPGVCQYTLPTEITTKVDQMKTHIHADIDAMSGPAADKQLLKSITDRLAQGLHEVITCDAARVGGGK